MTTVAVLVKSVPVGGRFLRIEDGALTRAGVPHGADPASEVALEWGLRAREEGEVDRVVAICMGPPDAADALRRAKAMGADDVLLVTDPALAAADVRTTACVLAAAVRHTGAGLALFGNESLDGSSGAVPAAVATLLDWPLVSLARTALLRDGTVRCERDLGWGPEVVEADVPAALSFVAGGVDPRYPKLKDVFAARNARVDTATPFSLGLALDGGCGRERVVRLEARHAPSRTLRHLDTHEGVEEIVRLLREIDVVDA